MNGVLGYYLKRYVKFKFYIIIGKLYMLMWIILLNAFVIKEEKIEIKKF